MQRVEIGSQGFHRTSTTPLAAMTFTPHFVELVEP
jgi:hypothetical protein